MCQEGGKEVSSFVRIVSQPCEWFDGRATGRGLWGDVVLSRQCVLTICNPNPNAVQHPEPMVGEETANQHNASLGKGNKCQVHALVAGDETNGTACPDLRGPHQGADSCIKCIRPGPSWSVPVQRRCINRYNSRQSGGGWKFANHLLTVFNIIIACAI